MRVDVRPAPSPPQAASPGASPGGAPAGAPSPPAEPSIDGGDGDGGLFRTVADSFGSWQVGGRGLGAGVGVRVRVELGLGLAAGRRRLRLPPAPTLPVPPTYVLDRLHLLCSQIYEYVSLGGGALLLWSAVGLLGVGMGEEYGS